MITTRLSPLVLAALAAVVVAGCGGGGSSGSDPASFAPPGSLVYVEGTLRPSGSLKSNTDAVTQTIAGVDNLGEFVVEELESSARGEGEPFDFEKEVEPWLGEKAGVAFKGLEEGNLTEPVIVIETTDAEATQEFIDNQSQQSKVPYKDASYEGIDYKVGGSEENAIGIVGDSLVIAEGEAGFKAAVDASKGESLADEARFANTFSAASDGSLADAYVDVGGLIDASEGGGIDPQVQEVLKNAGLDPSDATAVASAIPGSDQIEVDLSSDLGGKEAPSGDASKLLGSMPAESFAAFSATGFSDQLKEAVDELDASGIPSQGIPPNQLTSTLKAAGIDLDKIASSLEDAAVFATGSNENDLGGALVLTSSSGEAAKTVANLGILLRNTGAPGITAVSSNGVSGFSVHSAELGSKPLVVVAKEKRVALGYGLAPALQGLSGNSGETLADTPTYKEAVSALGSTPISAFVDGPAALRLAEALVPSDEEGFQEAKPYLKKVGYIALGTGSDGELTTATLIAGLQK
jgi:Protein of unknown function (DUF3352)